VTRGAQQVKTETELALTQASLWGLGKVVAIEHAELRPVLIDLDPDQNSQRQAGALLSELKGKNGDEQVAWRGENRFVARLSKIQKLQFADQTASESVPPIQLTRAADGILENLKIQPMQRMTPRAGEVEIEVVAAGLNFRDVLNALAVREDPEPLGSECSGRVSAIGPDVVDLAVGAEIIAIAPGSMASFVNTRAESVFPKPATLSHFEAATLPMAFLTADFALI